MPNKPSTTHRTPTENAAAKRVDRLADPEDATEVLGAVDTSRPLGARDGEHGHIDGPRGLQDFHRHAGGDRPHPHPRPTPTIPRSAALEEWVPPFAARPPTGDDADPTPATSDATEAATPDAGDASVATDAPLGLASVGSGGTAGAGRPMALVTAATSRSIGHVAAGHAIEAVFGNTDATLSDEKIHMRFAVEIALEIGAEDHRHGHLAEVSRLLDLEAAVLHMVSARGLRS